MRKSFESLVGKRLTHSEIDKELSEIFWEKIHTFYDDNNPIEIDDSLSFEYAWDTRTIFYIRTKQYVVFYITEVS